VQFRDYSLWRLCQEFRPQIAKSKSKSPAESGQNDVINIAQSMSISGITKIDLFS